MFKAYNPEQAKTEFINNLSKYEIDIKDFYDSISCCIFELFEVDIDINNIALLNNLYNIIPKDILIDAMKWHISDTEVRDNIFILFKNNEELIKQYL